MSLALTAVALFSASFSSRPPADRRELLRMAASAAVSTLAAGPARALDVDGAFAASTEGALCPTQSCVDSVIEKLGRKLDTAGMPRNAKGTAATRVPVVSVEAVYGARRDVSVPRYQIIVTVPQPEGDGDFVRLMWLRNQKTGAIVASRGINEFDEHPFGRKTPFIGPPTLTVDVGKGYAQPGDVLVPTIYCDRDLLWEGEPFTLCDPADASCDMRGKLRLTSPVDMRPKRPSGDIGKDVLSQRPQAKP